MNQNRKVMAYTKLIVEKQDNICTVKINNPEALNALNSTILKELDAAFTAIGEDDSVDVVILTGEGRSFVAGADISQMSTLNAVEGKAFGELGAAVFRKIELLFTSRLATDRKRTSDQYSVELLNIFKLHNASCSGFSGAIISSVVPEVVNAVGSAVETVTGVTPKVLSSDIGTGLKIVTGTEGFLGADLAVASVAAIDKYELPCFIVDLGTATKIILLDEDGVFLGCTISAGVGISLEALAKKTSQLPAVRLTAPPTSIGTNTVDCMQSGTVFGTAAMLDGLTARMERDFGRKVKTTVATGGLAEEIVKNCDREIIFDRDLILEGLKNIYKRKVF